MDHKVFKIDPTHTKEMGGKRGGIVGETHIWDGPLSQEGRPHAKGSSSGKNPMKLKIQEPCQCGAGTPITKRAKA